MTADTLRAAAATFLAGSELVAWESGYLARALVALDRFTAGALDADALRAALGDSSPTRSQSASPSKTTAVLELRGVLTPGESFFSWLGFGTSVRGFLAQLAAAVADDAVRSIAVVVDSPGGIVGILPEAAAALRAARERKPVVVSVAGLNASAAYWITSNATRIEATPSANVGAIGVFALRPTITRRLERDGVDVEVFSAGKYKTEGLEVVAVTDAERQAGNARANETYDVFVDDVAAGRRVSASAVRAGFGEVRIVSAKRALALGMIDDVATVENTIARVVAAPDASTLQAKRDAIARARLAPYQSRLTAAALASHRRALAVATDRARHDR